MSIAVSVIEDDGPLCRLLVELIRRTPGLRCVSHHRGVAEALRDLPWGSVEVVLLDLRLPPPGGVELLRGIKRRRQQLPVLVFSQHSDTKLVLDAVAAGADGYMLKGAGFAQIEAGIQAVHRGEAFFPPSIACKLADRVRQAERAQPPPFNGQHLTPREIQLLQLARQGFDYREMAARADCKYNTIRKHWDNIRDKLAVNSRAQAVVRFFGL